MKMAEERAFDEFECVKFQLQILLKMHLGPVNVLSKLLRF